MATFHNKDYLARIPAVPAGWRELKPNEVVKQGDKYYDLLWNGDWAPRVSAIGRRYNLLEASSFTIRRIAKPAKRRAAKPAKRKART